MRVLIMADMEGVSGIVVWNQVSGGDPMYEEGRKLYTEEINAAVRGAKRAGANEIVVVDCHGAGGGWTFNSLVPELLEPDFEWAAHHPWSRYTEFFEQKCDACLLIGMHAKAGTLDGVMCHTISTTHWRDLYFNDDCVGEVLGVEGVRLGTLIQNRRRFLLCIIKSFLNRRCHSSPHHQPCPPYGDDAKRCRLGDNGYPVCMC